MGDGREALRGCQGAGRRRGDIADDHHTVGLPFFEEAIEFGDDVGHLLRDIVADHVEVGVGCRQCKGFCEDFGELVVVVLAGVHKEGGEFFGVPM